MTLLRPGEILQGTCFQLKSELDKRQRSNYPEMVGVNACPRFPTIELTSSDVTRWKMASRLLESFKRADPDFRNQGQRTFNRRCKNWPDIQIRQLPIALGFSGAALTYGGLHALAWSAHFGSFREQLLWRMSTCVVMGVVPICYSIYRLYQFYMDHAYYGHQGKEFWFRAIEKVFPGIEPYAFFLWCLIVLAYILARAYLVVESFINLSHLPAGAYDLPEWSTYFPHFS